MMITLYVFLGVLGAFLVIYLFQEITMFIRKVNRNISERTPYANPYYTPRTTYDRYSNTDSRIIYELRDTLDRIEDMLSDFDIDHNRMKEKLDLLIEDAAELMIDKERPKK